MSCVKIVKKKMDVAAESSNSRRSLRVKTSSTPGAQAGQGSESPRSDISDASSRASRSSRLSNPEFAAKHKAFMAKVTAASKGSMDSYLSTEMSATMSDDPANTGLGGKRKALRSGVGEDISSKRRRNTKQNSNGLDTLNDAYCWICHKEGEVICCETCPRVFHLKCISLDSSPAEDWVCPECVLIMTAENMDTRSRAMRLLTVDQLCTLLKHALTRMKSVPNSEPFLKPVDALQFPAYKDYVSCPMDIQSMERNIRRKQYGSTEAMLADCKWILHNCIIFNSHQSKLTSIAKNIVKVCKHEMQEIENCPDCYLNAHIKKDTWFTEACRFPHPLVWAKLKGFPYWPGKIMRVNSENVLADIRFFGAHDRAWIALKDVFLFSEKPPLDIKKKRGNLDDCFDEVQLHIKKLRDRFGEFSYSAHKTHYDHNNEELMLKTLYPKFQLPFEIGSLARRARSYSFTGSERSRGSTPTPSEASMQEEDEEEEEEEGVEEQEMEYEDDSQYQKTTEEPSQLQCITITKQDKPRIVLKIKNDSIVETNIEPDNTEDKFSEQESRRSIEKVESPNNVDHVTQDDESQDSLHVVEAILEDSIEQSLNTVFKVTEMESNSEDDHEEQPELLNSSASELLCDKSEENTQLLDEEVIDRTVLENQEQKQQEEMSSTDEASADKVVERSATSPPCEVTSTTAVDKEVGKDKRIHGTIVDTLEPVIVEDEDPEIDDVEPVHQSEVIDEDSTDNDVMEIFDEEADVESQSSKQETIRKDPGETSKAATATSGSNEEIDDVEPLEDNNVSKSSSKVTPVDPTKLLAAGVSITVIDKKKGESSSVADAEKDSDISVTLVQKSKTSESSQGKFTLR